MKPTKEQSHEEVWICQVRFWLCYDICHMRLLAHLGLRSRDANLVVFKWESETQVLIFCLRPKGLYYNVAADLFVVELTGFPRENLPITWKTEEERPYAIALDSAIKAGLVTASGKHGVRVTIDYDGTVVYNVYQIIE